MKINKKQHEPYKVPKGKKEREKVLTKGDRCGRINKLSPREGDALGDRSEGKRDQKRLKKD